uniref:Nuclear factor 7, brain-like n=1 Tax=Cyprinodon variegatus TaxID=28743 RepID=A0A3Q2CPZ2_CYPVA
MTSCSLSEDLTCSVCQNIFTDPVILSCGHSFCRECITLSLKSLNQCPQCRTTVPTDRMDFTTNHILKSLSEKAKQDKESGKHSEVRGTCLLKLFCVTDQQLTCIICRDCEKHEGHKFKPIKEAAASIRKEVEAFLGKDFHDFSKIENLAKSQNEEIRKTKEKSQQLRTQISGQFQEMHQFLRRREDEIMNELNQKEADELKEMRDGLELGEKMKAILEITEEDEIMNELNQKEADELKEMRDGLELGEKMKAILEITEPEILLKCWSEDNSMKTKNPLNLQLVNSSLSVGLYESHLQLFMWKEMLQVIQPKAKKLSFKREDPPVWVQQGCSYNQPLFGQSYSLCTCHYNFNNLLSQYQKYCNPGQNYDYDLTIDQIEPGPNYWKIDVKDKKSWTVYIQDHSLTFKNNRYTKTTNNGTEHLDFKNRPETIGIYFNSITNQLQFFDENNMKHF